MRWIRALIPVLISIIITSVVDAENTTAAKDYDSEGKKMFNLGLHEEALQLLNKSIVADENYAEAWYDKGNILCKLCREKEAEVAWKRARNLLHEKAIISTPADCCAITIQLNNTPSESRSITWDFEVGKLRGWYPIGKAFEGQPYCSSSGENRSGHQGNCWVSSDGNAVGNMVSRPFRILGDRMDFLIGGCTNCTISLIVDDAPAMTAHGNDTEILERVVWDVSEYKRKTAYLRLSDASSSLDGQLYFDDLNYDISPRLIDSL